MGKHKNATQVEILLEFMENNPDLAKGFSKRDKALVESLWQDLSTNLNNAGLPTKEINGWKKVWTEWKSEVKKKLALNKVEARATGGGPFAKYQLSQTEEAIVRICAFLRSIDGVPGESFDVHDNEPDDETDDDIPSTSSKRKTDASLTSSTPKKYKPEPILVRLSKFLDEDNNQKRETNEKIDELIKIGKENSSSLRRIYRAVEKGNDSIANALVDLKNEIKNLGLS